MKLEITQEQAQQIFNVIAKPIEQSLIAIDTLKSLKPIPEPEKVDEASE